MGTKYAFGIDLGTTNSCIAVKTKDDVPKVIDLIEGSGDFTNTLPSCVMYDNGKIIVGKEAYQKRYDTKHVVYSSKRDIGSDKTYPIEINGEIVNITPVDVAAEVLSALKRSAEIVYGEVKDVTITVPAYFTAEARKATQEAAEKAGLNVKALINEPTAAALNYARNSEKDENILVYDLGGGTFDVTVLNIRAGSSGLDDFFGTESAAIGAEVLSTGGNRCLGGDDLDRIAADLAIQAAEATFKKEHPEIEESLVDFLKKKYPIVYEKIVLTAEQLKKRISTSNISVYNETFGKDDYCPYEVVTVFGDNIFAKAAEQIFMRTESIVQECMHNANIGYTDLDKVVLVGGSTKLIHIRNAIKNFLEKKKVSSDIIYSNFSPDEAVALGASINSAILTGEMNMEFSDVLSQSIGISEIDSVNGRSTGERYRILVSKNTKIPTTPKVHAAYVEPGETQVIIPFYQGDERLLEDNMHIGTVYLDIPKSDKPQDVSLKYWVTASGSLEVSASAGGNSINARLENILRPVAKKVDAKTSKLKKELKRLEDTLREYASDEDLQVGLDRIEQVREHYTKESFSSLKKFIQEVTRKNISTALNGAQDGVRSKAALSSLFQADGASAEEDSDEEE